MQHRRLSVSMLLLILAAVVAVLVSTAGGRTAKSRATAPGSSAITLATTPVGRVLADANGRTLYLFAGDKRDLSTLSVAGRAFWPPFTSATRPAVRGGAVASDIASVRGAAGAAQVTYNGHPLYYFVGDRSPGQATGQGLNQFGALWYTLSAAGAANTSGPQSGSSSTSTGGSYAY